MPSTQSSRDRACLARIARRRSPLELDQQRAEIVRIATAHGVPVPVPDFTEEQQARQVLAALSPYHRALGWRRDEKGKLYDNGGQDDGWDEMDVGLPAPLPRALAR